MIPPSTKGAERLYTPEEVETAVAAMAREVDARMAMTPCVALCVLQGGIVLAGMLLPRLATPIELDSIHVTRYRKGTQGSDVRWHALPETPLAGREVLLLDDIFDEGKSLAAIADWCRQAGASRIHVAVLLDKLHERKDPVIKPDVVGLTVDDRYVYGYGMDYHGWHRNAPGIFAVAQNSNAIGENK